MIKLVISSFARLNKKSGKDIYKDIIYKCVEKPPLKAVFTQSKRGTEIMNGSDSLKKAAQQIAKTINKEAEANLLGAIMINPINPYFVIS